MAEIDFNKPRKKASFRRVEFEIETSSDETSKRIQEHLFPNRNEWFLEDLGLNPKKFSVSGYITEPNMNEKRLALEEAFKRSGAGRFYHPMLNQDIQVRILSWTFNDSKDSLGRVNISLNFTQEGAAPSPQSLQNSVVRVDDTASQTRDQADERFNGFFSIEDALADVVDAAIDNVRSFIDYVSGTSVVAFAESAVNLPGVLEDEFDRAISTVNNLAQTSTVARVIDTFLEATNSDEDQQFLGLKLLSDFRLPDEDGEAESIQRINANANELSMLCSRYAVAEFSRLAVIKTHTDKASITAAREEVVSRIFRAMEDASNVNDLEGLQELQDLLRWVGEEYSFQADLAAPVADIETARPRTSLSLSWDLYGDADHADDLIHRNQARHGSFMPLRVEYVEQ